MTKEEIKKELLNDEIEQRFMFQNAQYISLITQLIRKGTLLETDINEIEKLTEECVEQLNEKAVNMIMEKIKEEEHE